MEQDLKIKIANGVIDYAKLNSLSNNDVARLTGVNAGYISNIMRLIFSNEVNGKQVLIGDKHFFKLAEFTGMATKNNYWELQRTRQFDEIISTLDDCKNDCKTALLIAPTGLGKTNAIDTFCKKNPQYTYRITVNSLYKLIDIINEMCEKVGAETQISTARRMAERSLKVKLEKISEKLIEIKHMGGEPILIIDEGENMELNVLKMMKGLFDIIKGSCSIVLVGTPKLLNNMLNSTGRNRSALPELYRRFKAGLRMITPLDKRVDFKPFFDKHVIDKGLVKLLTNLCDNYGELYDYLQPTLKECAEKGVPLTENFFRLKWNEQRFQ